MGKEQTKKNQEVAIKVDGVSKDFKITHEKGATLKSHFVNLLKGKKNRTIETQHALKNVSFEVKKGEFFGIVGRNGSGKSTMLKMLAGIYQPTKGKIQVEGKLVPFIELGVGFNPELTGRENVFLNGALLGFSEEEVAAFYDEVVEFAELEQFMDKKLKNYSSGMQVRLAFAMAVRAQADILLIDEVLAVGDADFQRKCFSYFNMLKKHSATVVFVSHDMEAIRQYCDRAALIDESELVSIAGADTISDKYTELFLESEVSSEKALDNEVQGRKGSLKAKIESPEIHITEDEISIRLIVTTTEVQEVVNGFRIKSGAGVPLFGTNSKIEKNRIKTSGDTSTVLEWNLPNILSDGDYTLDLTLHNYNLTELYDDWEDVLSFKIKRKRKLPYDIDPGFKIRISK